MQQASKSDLSLIWKWLLLPWMAAVTLAAYLWAKPLEAFQVPEAARIIFWHVPMAILGIVWFWIGAVHGMRFLFGRRKGEAALDDKGRLANEVGLVCTVLATISGSVFARVQWNTWWNWDPKQVTIVVLILIYLAYFGLRMSVDAPDQRARLAAAYSILGAVSSVFLTFIIPQLPVFQSLHPSGTLTNGLDPVWRTIFSAGTLGFFGITYWAYELRLRLARLEASSLDAEPEAGGGPRIEAVRREILRPGDAGARGAES